MEHLQQPGHHPPLVAPPVGDLQVKAVGKDGLIPARTVLLQPLPGPEQNVVLLLDDGLGPGGGHIRDVPHLIVGAHLLHVGVGDGIGAVHIDVLPVIGLQPQRGHGLHQGLKILRSPVVQQGLDQHGLRLEVVDGRAVGQHHRGVDGGQVDIRGKGAVGPPGGHCEPAALANPAPQGLQIPGRDPVMEVIEGVIKVADQQQTVKFAHGALLSAPQGRY